MTLVKNERTGNVKRNGHGHLSPFRNSFFSDRFLSPRLFEFNDDFWDRGSQLPLANISETSKEFKVDVSAPGLEKEDFKININHGVLTISSEKEEETTGTEKNYHRKEFSYCSFDRSFQLPENVDEGNIKAKYENGMLAVSIPKKEVSVASPKKEIKVT